MPTVAKAFNSADVFQGPAEIYLGVTSPASAVPPVQYTNTLQLDQAGQPPIGTSGQIATATLGAGGTGYAVGDTLTVVQSGAVAGMIRVLTVAAGVVATFAIIRGGQGYSVASTLPTTGGSGSGCTITIATITAGFHFGLSEGPASVSITPKFELIKADNFSAEIDAAFVSLACEMDFTVKEIVLQNMLQLFTGLFSATYWNLGAGGTNPAADLLQIGSTNSSQALTTTLMMVAPRRDAANKFLYALAYKTYIKSAIQFQIQRAKENMFKLKFACLADMNRVGKDRVMQVIRTT